MARKPFTPSGPSPGLGLMQRAQNSLAATDHAVFTSLKYRVNNVNGNEVLPGWEGEEVTHATVHEPTNVTRVWRAHFWPNKFHAFLDGDMTREEAQAVANNLLDLVNMRRNGA